MYQIIAPTLFQNKTCRLPGIGTLVMVSHPANTDFVNFRINPPTDTIDFIQEDKNTKVFNEFSAISELLQKNLDENGSFLLQGIGTFTKGENGEIKLVPVLTNPLFTPPVPVEIVTRQDASHAILAGNQQATDVKITAYFREKLPLKDQWWIWAALLAAIGISILLFYFYQQGGFNAFGNVNY